MPKPLLNCDMGESFGQWQIGLDEQVMPYVDCANIACGFHASDPDVMRKTVKLAQAQGVKIGAHPGYPDLVGFGRRSLACSPDEAENFMLYQLGALSAFCRAENTTLSYMKPHGALYNDMAKDLDLMRAAMQAILRFDAKLPLVVMSTLNTQPVEDLAKEMGVKVWFETFADRAYDASGHLVSRRVEGAVHHDQAVIVEQAVRLAKGEPLTAIDGSQIQLKSDTLCVHGDNAESIAAVAAIRHAFDQLGAS